MSENKNSNVWVGLLALLIICATLVTLVWIVTS